MTLMPGCVLWAILALIMMMTTVFAMPVGEPPVCSSLGTWHGSCNRSLTQSAAQLQQVCQADSLAIGCAVAADVVCTGARNWTVQVPCRHTSNYHFATALGLSIFLGNLGFDRCYLGYPAIGLVKFSTFGFFVFGNFIDIGLIATHQLRPADGSHYIVDPLVHPVYQRVEDAPLLDYRVVDGTDPGF